MKFTFTLALVCSAFSLFAQQAEMQTTHHAIKTGKMFPNSVLYCRGGIGYAFNHEGQTMNAYGVPYNGSANYAINGTSSGLTDFNLKKASFNAGTHLTLAGGFMFDSHVGVELAGQFNIAASSYNYDAHNFLSNGFAANSTITTKAKLPIMVIPAMVLQTGEQGFNLYTRLGFVLPVNTKIERNYRVDYIAGGLNGIRNKEYTIEQSSKFGLGYTGAIGFSYKADKIKLWAEFNVMSLAVDIKQEKVTSFANDGNAVPLQYVTPGTVNYTASGTANARPTYAQPFGYAGIMAGISFKI